ncbi:USP domain-containing protein [Caenorhabditis elegans]|uniref:USP domain-containing protein n=1 Tax=Caenorhabditis elegans TaxID=6239 RepID=G4SDS9_CAEEL|nr:USP domain-containing protein [Caenorhabditis elegans]CCD69495.1 USP domain-containing protein [Caenorhabditis elegans]|eukprot:NP_001254073.1 Uncharacterized protein CELE_F14D2.19 [Caenorhabditis elegans]
MGSASSLVLELNSTGIEPVLKNIDFSNLGDCGSKISNNEPVAPPRVLLLQNPNHLCWLNCILNILYKATSLRKMFYTWKEDNSICYQLAKIFQGVEDSADPLRKMLTNHEFHEKAQDVTEVLPCLLEDLKIKTTQKEVTFCNSCNEIRNRCEEDELTRCPFCGNAELTEGKLMTHIDSCFVITGDQFTILRPNEHFKINSVNYRLNAFAQYIESMNNEEDCGHYVSWTRELKKEGNFEETKNPNTTTKNNNVEAITEIQKDQAEHAKDTNNNNNNNEHLHDEYNIIQTEDNNEEEKHYTEYSIDQDFECIDDDKHYSGKHSPVENMIVNFILLERC